MKDSKVVKAMWTCLDNGLLFNKCEECPYKEADNLCMDMMIKDAIVLIKRQEAEIERLKENES